MSYDAIAALLFGQRPFMLFAVDVGAVQYRYCDQARTMTRAVPGVAATDWAASGSISGRIGDSALIARAEVTLDVPLSGALAVEMLSGRGYTPARVRIWRGFFNDPDGELQVQFVGRVMSVRPNDPGTGEGGTVTLTCLTDQAAQEHQGLSEVFGRTCRWDVYSPMCGLSIGDWQDALEVTAISSDATQVTVDAMAAPAGYYPGGIIEYAGRRVRIAAQTGLVLALSGPLPELRDAIEALNPGDPAPEVLAAPGCPRTRSACVTRFDNLLNFGGFPHIPEESPFSGRSIV